MKERPIIFNAEMVNAILSGRKTQTRRPVKFPFIDRNIGCELSGNELAGEIAAGNFWNSYLGQPGVRLWVRETCQSKELESGLDVVFYPADNTEIPVNAHPLDAGNWVDLYRYRGGEGKIVPSIHMPRWASRITLEITGVRVERLNSINENDALAEGLSEITKDGRTYKYGIPVRDVYPGNDNCGWPWHEWEHYPISAYSKLWQSISGAESWQANPWVWVIEFKRVVAGGN